jgi:tetratricopeptide (TPR) repeat protein
MKMTEQAFLKRIDDLMKDKRWEEAIATIEPTLTEGSASGAVLWTVGWAYFKLGQHGKAVPYLRRAAEADPTKSSNAVSLGFALHESKDYDGAEIWFLRALALRDTSLVRLGLALTYLEQGKKDVAEAVHEEGIRLKPSSRERLEAYADFLSDAGREEEAKKLRADAEKLPADDRGIKQS